MLHIPLSRQELCTIAPGFRLIVSLFVFVLFGEACFYENERKAMDVKSRCPGYRQFLQVLRHTAPADVATSVRVQDVIKLPNCVVCCLS